MYEELWGAWRHNCGGSDCAGHSRVSPISYLTANRSLLNVRQAQENSTATEIAQSQIEQLLQLSDLDSTNPNYIFNASYETSPFCVNTNGSGNIAVPTIGTTSNPCYVSPLYNVAINYMPNVADPSGSGSFKVVVTWADIAGEGNDSVTLFYQLYDTKQVVAATVPSTPAPSNVSWFILVTKLYLPEDALILVNARKDLIQNSTLSFILYS